MVSNGDRDRLIFDGPPCSRWIMRQNLRERIPHLSPTILKILLLSFVACLSKPHITMPTPENDQITVEIVDFHTKTNDLKTSISQLWDVKFDTVKFNTVKGGFEKLHQAKEEQVHAT